MSPVRAAGAGRRASSAATSSRQRARKINLATDEAVATIEHIPPSEPPEELLSEPARTLWAVTVLHMVENDTYRPEYIPHLINYCNSWNLILESDRRLMEDGITKETQFSEKPHPAIAVRNANVANMRQLSVLFGFDPLSRSRFPEPPKIASLEHNPFMEF